MDHNLTSLFALDIKLDRDDQTISGSNYAELLQSSASSASSDSSTQISHQRTIQASSTQFKRGML